MATTKEVRDYLLEELELDQVRARSMMGEYLLYYDNTLFGGIYDGRVLIKIVEENEKYQLKTAIPYDGAKSMYLLDDFSDKQKLKEIILNTCNGLNKTNQ